MFICDLDYIYCLVQHYRQWSIVKGGFNCTKFPNYKYYLIARQPLCKSSTNNNHKISKSSSKVCNFAIFIC